MTTAGQMITPSPLPPEEKRTRLDRLWIEAQGICHWCERVTTRINSPLPEQATTDHVIPRCRGGADNLDNVVLACLECNARRNSEDQKIPGHPSYAGKVKGTVSPTPSASQARLLTEARAARDSALQQLRQEREARDKGSLWSIARRRLALWIAGTQEVTR